MSFFTQGECSGLRGLNRKQRKCRSVKSRRVLTGDARYYSESQGNIWEVFRDLQFIPQPESLRLQNLPILSGGHRHILCQRQ